MNSQRIGCSYRSSLCSNIALIALSLSTLLFSGIAHTGAHAQTIANFSTPYFIENRGQWPDDVAFMVPLRGMHVWITVDAVIYDFHRGALPPSEAPSSEAPSSEAPSSESPSSESPSSESPSSESPLSTGDSIAHVRSRSERGHVVAMRFTPPRTHDSVAVPRAGELFVGPRREEMDRRERGIRGVAPLSARCTYIGGGHAPNAIGASLYNELWIDDIGGGVGMRLYIDEAALRYDIVIPAGADPAALRFTIAGCPALRVNPIGELVMSTSLGEVLQRRICAYQEYGGVRRHVACAFELRDDGSIGFEVGRYDRARPLVIDPLVWSTFLGGEGYDRSTGIARSANGDLFITGYTYSSDFPTSVGAYDRSADGTPTAFVMKLSGDGSTLHYATYIGGEGGAWSTGIAVDKGGAACITGYAGAGYPTTYGAYSAAPLAGIDAFATKLNAAGSALLYSTTLGGSGTDRAYAIALDADNRIYLTGSTTSEDFPTTLGAYDRSHNGGLDIFASRVTPASAGENDLQYSTVAGGSGSEAGYGLAVDDSGTVYVTGTTSSGGFPTTGGAYDRSIGGDSDGVVMRLAPKGNGASDLLYSTFIGGSASDRALGIGLIGAGDVAIVGATASRDLPVTAGALDTGYNGGGADAFFARLATRGNGAGDLLYGTFIGGGGSDALNACVMTGASDFFAVGTSTSSDFPVTAAAYDASSNGDSDLVLLRLAPLGSGSGDLLYASFMGGSSADEGLACVMRGTDTMIVTGATASAGYPTTLGIHDPTYNGGRDALVAVLVPDNGGTTAWWGMGGVTQGFARATGGEATGGGAGGESHGIAMSMRATPNPVADCLRIEYHLAHDAFVRMELSNAVGHVRSLVDDEWRESGAHAVEIDVSALPAGAYIVTLSYDRERIVRAVQVIR